MRDNFSQKSKDELAKRVGFLCSNPTCRATTIAPHSEEDKSLSVGVAAHITAASQGGARYDASLTNEVRGSIINGIWLCQNCATLIDRDEAMYSVMTLMIWKLIAEREQHNKFHKISYPFEQDVQNVVEITPPSLDFKKLAQFIMSDSRVKEFDDFQCSRPNTSMHIHFDENVIYYLQRLYWVGIFTLEDLVEKIDTYYDFIKFFVHEIHKTDVNKSSFSQILPGSLMHFVCYCVIFQEQSVNLLLDFWRIGGRVLDYKQNGIAANYLLIYNQYFSINPINAEVNS